MGLDITKDLAGVYTTITQSISYSKFHVIDVLTEAAPDDPQGGTVRLCTLRTGWKISAPRNPVTGDRQETLTVACKGSKYDQPAGQPAADLINLLARATEFELRDTRSGGDRVRYGRAESTPRPRTATQIYRQAIVMSETELTPWHDPA